MSTAAVDITGRVFGRLTAIKAAPDRVRGNVQWVCRCECGALKTIDGVKLRTADTLSCGCLRGRPLIDMIGQRYGKLVVLSCVSTGPTGGGSRWNCQCDCGQTKSVAGISLRTGNTRSCGCIRTPMDLTGFRFHRLEVSAPATQRHSWRCMCDCGTEVVVTAGNLTGGAVKSCGCFKLDFNKAKAKDIVGQKFGLLTAIQQVPKPIGGPFSWKCVCDCGNLKVAILSELTQGRLISCGCMANKGVAIRPAKVRARGNANTHRRRALVFGNGGAFTAEQIDALYLKQHGKCGYCHIRITPKNYHRDHAKPLSQRGTNDIGNIVLACAKCNLQKGAKDAIEFAQTRGRLL